ncbi:hypothetical protein CHS0354_036394 [Potamilus streckersoni]|uniref:G-protein coupled receptors family 1 profile domain-containing protein n=1 Tax=Potamilus streckersoni TaxID=2493646 RepID=A0AAE0W280_9BIVA|nr:hypothetical protein CHS0354_036394 [Potamilus streckersoni]
MDESNNSFNGNVTSDKHVYAAGDFNSTYDIYLSTGNFSLLSNGTSPTPTEETVVPPPPLYQLWQQVLICIVLGVLLIGTFVGNSLVCIAISIVKRLQSPSNLLILSLALSDLLVALAVMPFASIYEVLGYWPFSDVVCDIFTSLDVIMCTASILNLCMISVDRYFVITKPFQYAMKRTPKRMAIMITCVWVASVLISVPPLFGWKGERRPFDCTVSQAIGYQIYATLGSFYLPLTVMIVVYFRIWRVSSKIAKSEVKSKLGSFDRGNEQVNLCTKSTRSSGASENLTLPNGTIRNGGTTQEDETTDMLASSKKQLQKRRFTLKSLISRTSKSSSSKERKATKTLGIIMGGFTLCWLPFFILAVIRPFAKDAVPPWIISIFLWLGYFNSFLNPVIYARFNREFRTPFKEILCLRCKGINIRLRSESYAEQYGLVDTHVRENLRPPHDSVVRYNSQGQTVVQVGNGSSRHYGDSKI